MARLNILHVEDDPDDAFFLQRALSRARPECVVVRLANAEQAVSYLGECRPEALPDLLLVDLKLPGLSGFELLGWVRSQRRLQGVPVVVLSGSSLAEDRRQATELGARGYLVKSSLYAEIASQVLSHAEPSQPPPVP